MIGPSVRLYGLLCLLLASSVASAAGPAVSLVVNCMPGPIPPGGAICFNAVIGKPVTAYVVAVDANLLIATSYTGTAHITSSDPTASLPPDHTFAAADAGVWKFQVTFNSLTTTRVPSFQSITATDMANSLSGSQLWNVYAVAAPISAPTLSQYSIVFAICCLGVIGIGVLRNKHR